MIQTEWGNKHLCQSCGALFYDMQGKLPVEERNIICPNCNNTHNPHHALKLLPKHINDIKEEKDGTEFGVEEDDIIPEDTTDLGSNDEDVDIAPEEKENDES